VQQLDPSLTLHQTASMKQRCWTVGVAGPSCSKMMIITFRFGAELAEQLASFNVIPELYRWWCSVAIWWCHIALTRGFIVGEAALVVTNNSS
jgi:hypothetical protein